MKVKFYILKDRVCAWEFNMPSGESFAGFARPYKRSTSLDKLVASDFFNIPYTKKQLKNAEFIGNFESVIVHHLKNAEVVTPCGKYNNALKQTFGEGSELFKVFEEKAGIVVEEPPAELFIDFEAIDMRICGWYGEMRTGDEIEIFFGTAKPYSDMKRLKWKYESVYKDLMSYTFDEIAGSRHINSFESYFMNMVRRATKIYTYGDTDALFIKYTYGENFYNYFKVKNVDCSVRVGPSVLSLDRATRLFNIDIEGVSHDPRYDVERMMMIVEAAKTI